MADPVTIQVALRIRPLVESETLRGCTNAITVFPKLNQVQIVDKAFTYNYVFDETASQADFYETAIKPMIAKLFKGYNVTILAYGQTGSGKTHSMGTSYDGTGEMGVIPRAVFDIFDYANKNTDFDIKISVSFMELYQENLYDLLSTKPKEQCVVDIRENNKGITVPGLTEHVVHTTEETITCLINGSAGRATGATAMNATSSRSHAIFTINIYMSKPGDDNCATTAKFHLVDLAGSERSKKTKATGERFKEGVNINRGLLALGNVISLLGEDTPGYISYRDSKLTRLLQDSLGGNSITLMIACVSPADYNLEETLSTLRYADRARKIKNKPVVNQDPNAAEIARLNKIINALRLEKFTEGGGCISGPDLIVLREENNKLQQKNRELNKALSSALAENTAMFERALITTASNEKLNRYITELKETYNVTLNDFNQTLDHADYKTHFEKLEHLKGMIQDLHTTHQKNEEELQQHEIETTSPRAQRTDGIDEDFEERQEVFNTEQINLNNELKQLNAALALKEQLQNRIRTNTENMVNYQEMNENNSKMEALQKERDELLQQLKNVHTNSVSSKIAEQRRVRVKELETQIHDLHKKVQEQSRLIRMKEKDELKIKQLNNEIVMMKTNKVKLIKTMRAEEQKFRVWKQQREKDMMKLKEQDRKRHNQMIKMETMHAKQQTVLKRKVEEAVACNKRLKDALALQKQAHERRGQTFNNKSGRIEQWVAQELEVLVSTIDAERTLEQLIEDRALLNEELAKLHKNPRVTETPEGKEQIQQLAEDIEVRTAQIADLQQKIVDSDQENKSHTRWDAISTMIEAKCALKKLFDLAGNIRRKSIKNKYKLDELHVVHQEAIQKLEAAEQRLRNQSTEFQHEMSEIESRYEEKIGVLLHQLRGIATMTEDESIKERLRIQDEALEKMDLMRQEIEAYKTEVEHLKVKLAQVHSCAQQIKKPRKREEIDIVINEASDLEDHYISEDDTSNDPDWKNTPLFKRISALKNRPLNIERPIKRSSDGSLKCKCTTANCRTQKCGCKRNGGNCSEHCKCDSVTCQNRDGNNITSTKLFNKDHSDDENQMPSETSLKPKRQKKYFETN